VPGGKAVYPSSVVMNVVPAQVAGVGEVALASPPQADAAAGCTRHPRRARLLGRGVRDGRGRRGRRLRLRRGQLGLEPVDVVTGPGNNFVAAAKRAVGGLVGTDSKPARRRS
jgi:histidinol dehydrogenase